MPRAKLKAIGQRALEDRAFFEALVQDVDHVDATLQRQGLALAAPDLKTLKRALKGQGGLNLGEFIRRVHEGNHAGLFTAWDGVSWMGSWVPITPTKHRPTRARATHVATRARKTRVRARR